MPIRHLLFVCTGNICRSPFAAGLLRKMAAERGRADVVADSAGLLALPGNEATALAQKAASLFGVDLSLHRAKAVSADLIEWADLVLAMEKTHQQGLLEAFPSSAGKVLLLRHFGRHGSRNRGIADPYGLQYEAYRFCFLDIEDAVSGLAAYLSSRGLTFESVRVQCYEGYRANESPRSFELEDRTHLIAEILDRWYEGGVDATSGTADYFKVKTQDGSIYILRYNKLFDSWAVMV